MSSQPSCCRIVQPFFLAVVALLLQQVQPFQPFRTRILSRRPPSPTTAVAASKLGQQDTDSKSSINMAASSSSRQVAKPEPWQRAAVIDYSAANEYMAAHYSHLGYTYDGRDATSDAGGEQGGEETQEYYFPHTSSEGKATQEIYNARDGYFNGDSGELVEPSLERCGFQLVDGEEQKVTDWTDTNLISSIYLPQLRSTIERALIDQSSSPSSSSSSPSISHILFYQPMLRGENVDMGSKTSPVASLVHIDTDFGAHDVDGIVRMVERNELKGENEEKLFPRKELVDAISEGRRFAIINAWKGVNPDATPVERAHLGLLSPRYRSDDSAELSVPQRHQCYPALRPDRAQSRWYTYPQMLNSEVLLFKQYDRKADRVSDIWHCSLPVFPNEREKPPRTSFDCRALVVFEEVVLANLDRYSSDRPRPLLSLDESGCFCDSQAEMRGQ